MSRHDRSQLPSAPYPPMSFKAPVKSSLSSSPHYAPGYRTGDPTGRTPSPVQTGAREGLYESDSESLSVARQQFSESQKANRLAATNTCQLKFYPSQCRTLACINTVINSEFVSSAEEDALKSRKLGPILLELRKLELAKESDSDDQFFTTRTTAISRGNPQLGTSVSSTCMDIPIVQPYSTQSMAATGLSTGMLAIHTFSEGTSVDGLSLTSSIEYFHTSRHHRQASAVAWRTDNASHVAIGLLGSGTPGTSQGNHPRRGGPNLRGSGGDREFCCFLWDIESQQSATKRNAAPIAKLSHNAPVVSLAWVLDGQTLAVGTQSRNVQLYDMRVSGTNAPPLSALAHNYGVHGIEVDPHKQYQMATFSRSGGDPVKLWDIRRMDSVVSEIKMTSSNSARVSQTSTSKATAQNRIEAVKWSSDEPGMLSVAIGEIVQDFDTSSGSRPVLVRSNQVLQGGCIKDLALYSSTNIIPVAAEHESDDITDRLVKTLYPRRMLVVLEDRTVCDMAKHGGLAPLAISRRDGRLVHALGNTVWVGSTTGGPAGMENSAVVHDEDISATMMRRARCSGESRYSSDALKNIQMLVEDVVSRDPDTKDMTTSSLSLLRLWSWTDRVENLAIETEEAEGTLQWPAKGLQDAGVVHLLGVDGSTPRDEVSYSPTLNCNVFVSLGRRLSLIACGWAGRFGLDSVITECRALGEPERAAALAVWHGDIGAAVEALHTAANAIRTSISENKTNQPYATPQYAETLSLIAMCVAGYSGSSSSQSNVWQSACSTLLSRDDFTGPNAKSSRIVYLRALCQFLLHVGSESRFDEVLENEVLAYGDRVAFACLYLDREQLRVYLENCLGNCQQWGNLEGLLISGLSKDGIKILEAFVDKTCDVQTAALIVSRVALPADWVVERKICTEWIEAYRGLLNTWQMWQSRASFDIHRAEALRRIKSKGNDFNTARRVPGRRQGSRPIDSDALTSIPAGLDARCNYCSTPLGLRRHEGNANQWLSKMKPVLSCCPQCRKPLPRCAICLLSLGALNPYVELTRERSRSTARSGNPMNSSENLSALPLAEWFTWCMSCKHGGHAHHLVGWFANHETCPVSGCDCRCQFDGIQRLNRPALTGASLD